MTEQVLIFLYLLFVLCFIGWIVSLFYIKRTMVPMFGFVIAINVINIFIQIYTP